MQVEYVFADHGVKLSLISTEGGLVTQLSDADVKCLQQCLYLAVSCFVYARAMYLAEGSQADGLEG